MAFLLSETCHFFPLLTMANWFSNEHCFFLSFSMVTWMWISKPWHFYTKLFLFCRQGVLFLLHFFLLFFFTFPDILAFYSRLRRGPSKWAIRASTTGLGNPAAQTPADTSGHARGCIRTDPHIFLRASTYSNPDTQILANTCTSIMHHNVSM